MRNATPESELVSSDMENSLRLEWVAPVLSVYDSGTLTHGTSDQSTDGYVNTHS